MYGNKQYIDTKNYNNSKPSISDELKGRGTDTELRVVDDQESHVNAWEALILDQTRIDGIPEVGEELVKELGSGTINPETGKPEYDMGEVGGMMSSAAGMMTGGAAATTGAVLGPLGLVLMAGSMIKGAFDEASAVKEKIGEIGKGISKIGQKRQQVGERAVEDIQNIWEGVGSKLSDIRQDVGQTYQGLSKKVGGIIKGGKGLATGNVEKVLGETTGNIQESVERQTTRLEEDASTKVDIYGRSVEEETESMTMAIQDMQAEITELRKKDTAIENII